MHSEARVKELERKLRTFEHNEHFLQSQQQKMLKYDEVERQLKHLTDHSKEPAKQYRPLEVQSPNTAREMCQI